VFRIVFWVIFLLLFFLVIYNSKIDLWKEKQVWIFSKTLNHVYLNYCNNWERLVSANAITFKNLSNTNYYKDIFHIYYFNNCKLRVIENASLLTFKVINYWYAKDRKYVYYYWNVIEWLYVKTFEFFEKNIPDSENNSSYVKDKYHIFYQWKII
jgi:hypothetical protein